MVDDCSTDNSLQIIETKLKDKVSLIIKKRKKLWKRFFNQKGIAASTVRSNNYSGCRSRI